MDTTEGLGGQAAAKPAPETVEQRLLRHIRNILLTWLILGIVGAAAYGITVAAVAAHDHTVQQQNACNNNGGVYVNGQCI